ncbi:MAG: helix-turn-helix domain-containing protein [Treponema sp.]|nr:helix-turn-helix domain-containing protein [Treponema sp.]
MPRPRKEKLPELNLSQSIGQNIARIRKSRGLTQIELGNIIGINQYQISDYEIGRLHLSDEMIIRFAKALKTTSDDILGLKESDNDVEKPSLKIIRRLIKIEKLSEADQKSLLKTIDMFLKAAEK